MKASEEFDIRMRKAIEHFRGARELGLPKEQIIAELQRLTNDDDLIDRLYDEDTRDCCHICGRPDCGCSESREAGEP